MEQLKTTPRLCFVIGSPIQHSLSPVIHNAAYRALGIEKEFFFGKIEVVPSNLPVLIKSVRSLGVRGLAVTSPLKEHIIDHVDTLDDTANAIGAVNTVVQQDGKLLGTNTDWLGIIAPLEQIGKIKGKQVAILGAGGAARATIFGLLSKGAKVTLYNRTFEKAQNLAKQFGCTAKAIEEFGSKNIDILINTTSVGQTKDISPIEVERLKSKWLVFDAVYKQGDTALLRAAKKAGCQTLSGREMLLHQAFAQFELFTDRSAPREEMLNVVMREEEAS